MTFQLLFFTISIDKNVLSKQDLIHEEKNVKLFDENRAKQAMLRSRGSIY